MNASLHGIHHITLNTDDMERTVEFYTWELGMPLIQAMRVPPGVAMESANRGNPPFENIRYYFFEVGNGNTLAFFEMPPGATPRADRNAVGAMQHIAFATDAAGAVELLARLERHGIENSGVVETQPGLNAVYFLDPNGIRLEFAWQPAAVATQLRVIENMPQTRHDALAELHTLNADPAWLERSMVHWAKRSATSHA
jgi:catechol 2,3-dioxygenase-like lactoylglutathione lyase family enzyme